MSRDGLGSREEAKVRTLKVLFEFVKLKPQEILELGKEFPINRDYWKLCTILFSPFVNWCFIDAW